MRESSTYQAILAEGEARGEARGERRLLILVGSQRFGPPDRSIRRALDALDDVARIERISARLFQAATWEELLAAP